MVTKVRNIVNILTRMIPTSLMATSLDVMEPQREQQKVSKRGG